MTDRLGAMLKYIDAEKKPPVERWTPEHCADMDLVITQKGDWVHEGRVMTRQKLVKLFSSILIKEANDYFLVTPVEKIRITVENTPFVVVSAEQIEGRWFMTNNLGEVAELTSQSQLSIQDEQNPFVLWRRNLSARISQSVMYQWQVYALDHGGLLDGNLYLTCANEQILIGQAE